MTTIVDMISNNKTTSMFVKEENVNLLWNIIINTPAFKTSIETNGDEGKQKLRSYYIQHVRTFVEENIYDTSSIVEFNKKFISYFIKKFQPSSDENVNATSVDQNKTNTSEVQKLHIDTTNNLDKNAITIEEIKSERLNEFEDKYQKLQNDFDVYRKNEVPDGIDFSDKKRDKPIDDNDFQQQISFTNEERKTQETTFSKNTDSHTQAMKWLNLKEPPKPTVVDKPSSSPQINENKNENENNQTQKTQTNKNELVSENKPAAVLQQATFSNEISTSMLWSTIIQSNNKIDVLNKTVDVLKKKIQDLEAKLNQVDINTIKRSIQK